MSGFFDIMLGAICGAAVVAGTWADRARSRRREGTAIRTERAALARKITLHHELKVSGDVWTLTGRDVDVILAALKEKA